MNPQREFMSETFHTLAQPIMALRATVELGLLKNASEQDSHLILEDCLRPIDRLMQDMAVLREITSLDEEPPLNLCDGQATPARIRGGDGKCRPIQRQSRSTSMQNPPFCDAMQRCSSARSSFCSMS